MKQHIYSLNLKAFKKYVPDLYRVATSEYKSDCKYFVEPSKKKVPTLSIEYEGKIHQIHSRYDPEREAAQQAEKSEIVNPKILVVCGIGLAYHINALLEKYKNEVGYLIIIERDTNAFKTAVENVDLTHIISRPRVGWFIGVSEEDSYKIAYKMLESFGIEMQLYLKTLSVFSHPVLSSIFKDYYKKMIKSIREAGQTVIFNYGNSSDDSLIGLDAILKNLPLLIRTPGIKDLYGCFKGKPGIIVSTGPSLNKNIDVLKKAEGKSVIIACDASLRPMYLHGLKPDMTVSLERIYKTAKMYNELPDDYKNDIYLAACPVIKPESYENWCGPKIMVYRDFAHFQWLGIDKGTLKIGPSCSNQAFKILEAMGCDPIILVGQDCSFESKTKTHAEGASEVTKLGLQENELYKVKGNYTDFVYTNSIYDIFRKCFVSDIVDYKGTCINATEGGAYIEGTKLMTLDEAVSKYCTEPVDVKGVCSRYLKFPTKEEIKEVTSKFLTTVNETAKEVQDVIKACDDGMDYIEKLENRLMDEQYTEIDDFLERFPDDDLEETLKTISDCRNRVIGSGKYFNLYLMHILQMIVIHLELSLKALPSQCQDKKRCKLQTIKLFKKWFPEMREVSRMSLEYIHCSKAERYRNNDVFEESLLENKPLKQVSWEHYKNDVLEKSPDRSNELNLMYCLGLAQQWEKSKSSKWTEKIHNDALKYIELIRSAIKQYFGHDF